MDAWLISDLGLEHFPVAFSLLQEYALVSLVDRKIEAVHAMIKKIGKSFTFALPPYICARLRQARSLEMLRNDMDFYRFCVSQWRSRTLIDQLLALRCSKADLKKFSLDDKIRVVYQCSLESEFETSTVPRAAQGQWLALTNKSVAVELPQSWKLCIEYWKCSLKAGSYYTLPRDLFMRACEDRFDVSDFVNIPDPAALFLESAAGVRLFRTSDIDQMK